VLGAFVELLERNSALERDTANSTDKKAHDAEKGVSKATVTSTQDNSDSKDNISAGASRPWVPVLGRTAAGIVHFWSETGSELPSVTELSDLIERHCHAPHRQLQPCTISSDPGMADIAKLDALQVSIVQLKEISEDGVCEFIDCAQISRNYPGAFALRIDGDSMSPHICDGDIVVASAFITPRDGTTAVVKLHDQIGVTCKIFRRDGDRVHLIAANEKYDTKVYNQDEVAWARAVLWRIRLQ